MKIVLVILASVALALAQDEPAPAPEGGGTGQACAQSEEAWTGSEPQTRGKKCGQLSKDDCTFVDEAINCCPSVCGHPEDITPSPANNQPGKHGPKKKKGCFHGDDTVQTQEHGRISISRLAELRDAHVLTRNEEGSLEYSQVRYWLHAQASVGMKFYTLTTESGHRLALTGEHLIYETDCRGGRGNAIYAKNAEIGQCLYVQENGRLNERRIVAKEQEKKVGIYSPITTTGSIVVNDVLASCYNYYENEALQKFVYQYMIGFQDALASWLPKSLYEAAFNSQEGASVAVPRLILNFLQMSNLFVH